MNLLKHLVGVFHSAVRRNKSLFAASGRFLVACCRGACCTSVPSRLAQIVLMGMTACGCCVETASWHILVLIGHCSIPAVINEAYERTRSHPNPGVPQHQDRIRNRAAWMICCFVSDMMQSNVLPTHLIIGVKSQSRSSRGGYRAAGSDT